MVLDNELHQQTIDAVQAAGAALDEYLAREHRWVPTVHIPTVTTHESGWPRIVTETWSDDNRVPDFSRLFGSEAGTLKPLAWADVPELQGLIDYVLGRADLTKLLRRDAAGEWTQLLAPMWAADLALSILDRARAVGVNSVEAITELYEQRERSWLATSLPVEYVVPLVMTPFSIDETATISDRARIEPLDASQQAERGRHFTTASGVPEPLLAAATHALVIAGDDLPNEGPIGRMLPMAPDRIDVTLVDSICEALRIVSPAHVGYATVLRRPLGWTDRWIGALPVLTPIETTRRYAARLDRFGWQTSPQTHITGDDIKEAAGVLESLQTANPRVRLAARRLSMATNRDDVDDRVVDACIGFEALLGDDPTELTHRMAVRAATVLATRATSPSDPEKIYHLMKKIYSHRSKVVHGNIPDKQRTVITEDGQTFATADLATHMLRLLLLDIAERPGGWTPKSLDALALQSLTTATPPSSNP